MIESWYKTRTYLHFDSPLSYAKAKKLVSNPGTVARHAFLPFLSYSVFATKVGKDDSGNIIQKPPKERPIAFAGHADSHIYAYYCEQLTPLYEKQITENYLNNVVLAFRKTGKSNIDFAHEAFETIKGMGECAAIGFDISGFFDNLDHNLIKDSWASLRNQSKLAVDEYAVFKSITRFATVDREKVFEQLGIAKNNPKKNGRYRISSAQEFRDKVRNNNLINVNTKCKGIPQGSPISAFLSNLYMLEFDKWINSVIEERGGKYFRYCDDMLFIVPISDMNDVANLVRTEIKKLKIDINPNKTEKRKFKLDDKTLKADKPLQYLGFLFDGSRVFLRSASLAKYSERMRRGVRLAKKTQRKHNIIRMQKGAAEREIYRKKLYSRYSHFGRRNFIIYGFKAAEKMNSPSIKRQLKPLWRRLQVEIEK